MSALPANTILVGDALTRLRQLPAQSVDCCITSPPYFQLRDYGAPEQLGLEPTVDAWVEHLREVVAEIGRVLTRTGSLWLNLGDSYSRHARYGAPAKGLLLGPERVLLALTADGWICRNKVIWAKPNPLPASVADRLNTTYEVIYFLVRSRRYYFDLDAIRRPHRTSTGRTDSPGPTTRPSWAGPLAGTQSGLRRPRPAGQPGHALGKNPGDVWSIGTHGFRGAHFATFPEALVEQPLLSSCPERVCTACGSPWRRRSRVGHIGRPMVPPRDRYVVRYPTRWQTLHYRGRLRAACGCRGGSRPGFVLDPFFGSGTVGVVATRHGRDWLGIELNPAYADLATQRLGRGEERSYHRESPAGSTGLAAFGGLVDVMRLQAGDRTSVIAGRNSTEEDGMHHHHTVGTDREVKA